MAVNFGATFGAGTTDSVLVPGTATLGTTVTVALRFWQNGDGGGGTGRATALAASGNSLSTWTVAATATGSKIRFTAGWSGAAGSQATWTFPRPTLNTWYSLVWTYDGGNSANNAAATLNGTSQSITRDVAPSGTLLNGATNGLFIGNRVEGDRVWDGALADVGFYNRIWSASEIAAYHAGASIRCNLAGLMFGHDLRGDPFSAIANGTCTVTGTAHAAGGPKVFYPQTVGTSVVSAAPFAGEVRRLTLHGVA